MPDYSPMIAEVNDWISNPNVREFISNSIKLCKPSALHFCDGSEEENQYLLDLMVGTGMMVKLNEEIRPNSYLARSSPSDVARVEERTFICTPTKDEAGPTNNWIDPIEAKDSINKRFDGSMVGRTMYVIPFSMAPVGSPFAMYGVQLSDSPYVVTNMKIMTRMGESVRKVLEDCKRFTKCLHSVGAPLAKGQQDTAWPSNPSDKIIAHMPQNMEVFSYGSGYGGNALLSKKCTALRIASYVAKEEGDWLAEHMYILELTSPQGDVKYVCGAYPSACGKTNTAMLVPEKIPSEDGMWTVKCIGDDIAWLKIGKDGRLYAVNPENGFFGVAPGTNNKTNPNIMATVAHTGIFTNCGLTPDGDVYWDGMYGKDEPAQAVSWLNREWFGNGQHKIQKTLAKVNTVRLPIDRIQQGPVAHPNSRFTIAASQCPVISSKFEDPEGVPISAIIFGGRRDNTIPLVYEANDWEHGTFIGATLSSQTTAAAVGQTGVLRNDPMSMKPFIGYNACDYFQHWVDVGRKVGLDKMPKVFHINVFRKNAKGEFIFPGFGHNIHIFKWIAQRCDGTASAVPRPLGLFPAPGALEVKDMGLNEEELFSVSKAELEDEVVRHEQFFQLMGRMPASMQDQLNKLKQRVAEYNPSQQRARM